MPGAIDDALSLALDLEKGQAATPLADLFVKIRAELSAAQFPVTLLALGDSAKTSAMKWLYGQQFALFSVQVSAQLGLLELDLRDKGFLLERSDGRREEFAELEPFRQAIQDSDLYSRPVEELLRDPPRISAAPAGAAKNLRVLLPDGADLVREHPALLTRLVRKSALLVVVAEPGHVLTESESVVIRDLLEDLPAAWPVLVVDELAGDGNLPARGWWHAIPSQRVLPPRLLTTHVAAELPQFLTELADPLRDALKQCHAARRFTVATETLENHFTQTLLQLQSRRQRELARSDPTEAPASPASDNGDWSRLRNRLSNEVQRLQRGQDDRSRRWLLKGGEFDESLKSRAGSIQAEDLDTEQAYKAIKLRLGDRFMHGFTQSLRQSLKEALRHDLGALDADVNSLAAEIERDAAAAAGYPSPLPRSAPDERAIWSDIKEAVALELAYEGEMKKRGLLERLGEGRRSVFVILMSASLLGYMGFNLRGSGLMAWLLAPVFVGAIAWSFVAWKREDRERMGKELAKVRNEVLQLSRRLAAEVDRLKVRRIAEHLERTKAGWQEHLDRLQRASSERQALQDRQQVQQGKQRAQSLEQKINDWRGLRGRLDGVTRRARESVDSAFAALDQVRR